MSEHILIVDDEKEIADLVGLYLGNEGYTVSVYNTGKEALQSAETQHYDLAILDVMLPDLDGFSICRKLREKYFYPIIMLTAKVEDLDKILGLTIGADDYITKPYNPTILLLRIQNIFKRMDNNMDDLFYDNISVNPQKGILKQGENVLELTKNEMIIFTYLLSNRGRIVTRDDLMTDLWNNNEFINDNALTVNISRLRNKLQNFGLENRIETRKGQGYKLL
mgnify:CR=1 FL=1